MGNNRKGYGIKKQYDEWYYKDPITETLHGPFTKRDEARILAHKLKAEHTEHKEKQTKAA